jgi:capsular exopolysaccharide synthesis family protein
MSTPSLRQKPQAAKRRDSRARLARLTVGSGPPSRMPHQPESLQRPDGALVSTLRVLRRRRWLLLLVVIVTPLVALCLSLVRDKEYASTAQVLLARQNLANDLTDTPDASVQPAERDRIIQTQASVARVPQLASRVVRAAGVTGFGSQTLLDHSTVSPRLNTDLLEFTVRDTSAERARRLASEYAREFTIYRRELDTASLARAREDLQARIRRLRREPDQSSRLISDLVGKEQQLQTLEALQTSNASVIREGDRARQVAPRPLRDTLVALFLGFMGGLALVFLRDLTDTRVRSADEISELLGLPLLARLPAPDERRLGGPLVMRAAPGSAEAEAFRVLRTSIELQTIGERTKKLMVTSALEREGKSTTFANLAVAFARGNRRVVLVDLDLRRPRVDSLFGLGRSPGVTDVVLGRVELTDALRPIDLSAETGRGSSRTGSLHVLTCGLMPPDPGEFVGREAIGEILEQLASDFDVVLIDAPPILAIGDARTLSQRAGGIVVVVGLARSRRPALRELARVLASTPVASLGFVVAGAELEEGAGYGYGYGYGGGYESDERAGEIPAQVGNTR